MAGIFLDYSAGGVDPGSAVNSFTPHNTPTCPATFFPPDCSGIITDDLLNALISEIGQAVDNAGLAINCGRTDNLNRAIMTHGQTVGYCGANRADAEAQKGGPLVPGDYWLNTSTGTVYVVDAGGGDWALPNQPAAFLCCDGTLYARCGGTYSPVIGGGGGGTIPGTDVTITACPSGPINADTTVQDAICTLSGSITPPGVVSGVAFAVYTGAPNTLAQNTVTDVPLNSLLYDGIGGVSISGIGLSVPPGRYIATATIGMRYDGGAGTQQRIVVRNSANTILGSSATRSSYSYWDFTGDVYFSVGATTTIKLGVSVSSGANLTSYAFQSFAGAAYPQTLKLMRIG